MIRLIRVSSRKYFLYLCLQETGVGPGLFLATIFDVQFYLLLLLLLNILFFV